MKTRTFNTTSNGAGAGAMLTIAAPRAVSARPEVAPNIPAGPRFAQITPTEAVTRAIRTGTGTGTGTGAEHLAPVLSVVTRRRTITASR